MKIQLKKPSKLTKKHLAFSVLFVALITTALAITYNKLAHAISAETQQGLESSYAPRPSQFTRGDEVYLEISQIGPNTSLDAAENWTKIYFDYNRASAATIGIYDGAFTGCGADFSGGKPCVNNSDAVNYEYYAATENKPDPVVAPSFVDDVPCIAPFGVRNSSNIQTNGWNTLDIAQFLNTGCDGKPMKATRKTGMLVIFVRSKWKNENGTNRTNAFKIGGAYTDGKSPSGALTGYWSRYDRSITQDPQNLNVTNRVKFANGQYAVQDRIGANVNEQGNYSFPFGPDCYLKKDELDPRLRYVKWFDIDRQFYTGLPSQPSFELFDTTAGKAVELTDTDGTKYTTVSGSALGGPGIYKQMRFQGRGGHIYAWRWKNIAQRDGIVFWMPYDDFPYLNNGCGTYNQKIDLYQGRNSSGYTKGPLEVTGGDTVNFLIDEQYVGGTSAAPRTTTHQNLVAQAPWKFADALLDPVPGRGITDNGVWNVRAAATWVLDGMGPSSPYTTRRWLQFSYKVKEEAENGAKYCVTSDLFPWRSSKPNDGITSNQVCFTVNNLLRPYVNTSDGDVHAGDCLVTTANNGKIIGQPINGSGRGSTGSYIVSAGDTINGFGSGRSTEGISLTFGKGGKYGTLCRPLLSDLQKDINKSIDDGATVINADGQDFNLATLNAGTRYIVKFSGNGAVHGQSSAPVTVIAGGTLTVTTGGDRYGGRVVGAKRSFSASRKDLPVVGMIAKNIKLHPWVAELNAALYAVNNINTCDVNDWANTGFDDCRVSLVIRGFAMAGDFSLRRISGAPSGLQLSEQIDYGAEFYLNPPPGFRVPGDVVKYLGEQAPLY